MKPPAVQWLTQVQHLCAITNGARNLAIALQQDAAGKWAAVAIETDATTVQGALDSHSHDFLGRFRTEKSARAWIEKYARKWWRLKERAKPCVCGPIATVPQ